MDSMIDELHDFISENWSEGAWCTDLRLPMLLIIKKHAQKDNVDWTLHNEYHIRNTGNYK